MAGRRVSISAINYIRRQHYAAKRDAGEVSLKEYMLENDEMKWNGKSGRCDLARKIAEVFEARKSLPNQALFVVVKDGEPLLVPCLSPNPSHFPFIRTPFSQNPLLANQVKQCSVAIAQVLTGLPPMMIDSELNLVEKLTSSLIAHRRDHNSLHTEYGPVAGESAKEFFDAVEFVALCYDVNKIGLMYKQFSDRNSLKGTKYEKFQNMTIRGIANFFKF